MAFLRGNWATAVIATFSQSEKVKAAVIRESVFIRTNIVVCIDIDGTFFSADESSDESDTEMEVEGTGGYSSTSGAKHDLMLKQEVHVIRVELQ